MGIEAVFRQPFAQQVDFFRGKLGNLIPTERWTDVWKSAHDTGFMVAGAAKADLLADLAGAVDGAIADGQSIEWFRAQFDDIVKKHGWTPRGEYNWRTRTIYRTNMATSYSAGRLVQLREGGFTHWMYRHSDAVARPRPLHVSWDGLTLPANDGWWDTHYPPNGWGCQCYVVGTTRDGAKRLGGRLDDAPDDGVTPDGRPNGIDKGWDYQPGATSQLMREIGRKAEALPGAIGAAMLTSMAASDAFSGWVSRPQGSWPIAVISDQDALRIGAETRTVLLSPDTMQKQLRVHPDLALTDYAEVQSTVTRGTRIQDTDQTLIFLLEEAGFVTVVKATRSGKGLFMTSFRRLSRNQVKRDEEVRRILRKGNK